MTLRRLWMFLATAFALPACSAFTLLNATISEDGFTVQSGIRYGPDVRHGLDIYVPKKRKGPLPVVVFSMAEAGGAAIAPTIFLPPRR